MTELQPCPRHPKELTALRCSKCESPICHRCAVLTPVGYRCPECGKERSALRDVPLVLHLTGMGLGLFLGWGITLFVPRWHPLFTAILGIGAGLGMGAILSWVLRRKRSAWVAIAASLACLIGTFHPIVQEATETTLVLGMGDIGKSLVFNLSRVIFSIAFCVVIWHRVG